MNKRFVELDSLRGLASLSVLFCHFMIIIPLIDKATYTDNNILTLLLKYTPLHVFWSGHEAVIFFFILSGFVLSLPFYKDKEKFNYIPFIVKRVCRIYIPYLIAISFALIMCFILKKVNAVELSTWFNTVGSVNIDKNMVADHLILIKSFKFDDVNPVIWSLVHEMRISILFPLLMIMVLKLNWKINLGFAVVLSIISRFSVLVALKEPGFPTDYLMTLHYISFFIVGALLAKHRNEITSWFSALSKKMKYVILLIAILAYTHSWWFYLIKPLRANLFHVPILNDWGISLGVAAFIVFALSTKSASNILNTKPIVFAGKISYSLYLYHFVCMTVSVNLLYGLIPLWLILCIAFISSFALATISYYVIEVNSINLGKHLASKTIVRKKLQVEP